MKEKEINSTQFRKELVKIMPGYKWTVHRNMYSDTSYISATGIQTAGFNRLSTLLVVRIVRKDEIKYKVKSAGYGLKAPWLEEYEDGTLARALRGLQDRYNSVASNYENHAGALAYGRVKI